MHVFCDESGGLDNRKLLLVAALRIEPGAARIIARRFKKRESWSGELKGHAMSVRQRDACLSLLFEDDVEAAVVVCDARTAVGSYIAKQFPESRIYGGLLESGVIEVLRPPFGGTALGVTADGGRFSRAVEDQESRRIDPVIRPHLTSRSNAALLTFEASDGVAGLQLSDVVANFAYSHLAQAADAAVGAASLRTVFASAPFHRKARLILNALGDECPRWLLGATDDGF